MQRTMRKRKRAGTIIILFVILLPLLLLFVGFAVDFAYVQKTRSELRRATDLAAKAAACNLSDTGDQALALQTAIDIAALNKVNGDGLTLVPSDVVFGISKKQDDGKWKFTENIPTGKFPNAVRVTGNRTDGSSDGKVNAFFGAIYGGHGFEPKFEAIAAYVNVDICLVLDRSSSMKLSTSSPDPLMSGDDPRFCDIPWADSRWIALKSAVAVFSTRLENTLSKERVGVVTFASNFTSCDNTTPKVSVDQQLTADLEDVEDALIGKSNELWNGMTDIAAGLAAGREVLLNGHGNRKDGVKILILLTDGQYTEDDPIVEAQICADNGISISTITFSQGANQTDMQSVAAIANGRHFHADTPGQLDAAFYELGGAIAGLVD